MDTDPGKVHIASPQRSPRGLSRAAKAGIAVAIAAALLSCAAVPLVAFSLFLRLAGKTGAPADITSADGICQITLPPGWVKAQGLNEQATIQAAGPFRRTYLLVISEARADTVIASLQEFSLAGNRRIVRKLSQVSASGPVYLKIRGKPAIRYEIRGVHGQTRVVYLYTCVETDDYFHQILTWASPTNFERRRYELDAIAATFRQTEPSQGSASERE
jgi:hypothetical protein